MGSVLTPKKNLFFLFIEACIGLCFAAVLLYLTGIVTNIPLIEELFLGLSEFSFAEFLNSGFNETYVPQLEIFKSLWVVLLLVLVFLISAILSHNYYKHKSLKKNNKRQSKYQDFFANVVADQDQKISTRYSLDNSQQLKQHLSKDDFTKEENRRALLKELKAMHDIISGSEKSKLRELYFGLGFVDELKDKFNDTNWYKRVEAIQEAKQFGVSKEYPSIFKLVNDPKELVRRHALIARVDLDEQPLSFLGEIDYTLSVWERHKILSALVKLPSYKLPNFSSLYEKYPLHKDFLMELSNYFFDQKETATIIRMA